MQQHDRGFIFVNQKDRRAECLAVDGISGLALVRYEMPNAGPFYIECDRERELNRNFHDTNRGHLTLKTFRGCYYRSVNPNRPPAKWKHVFRD